MDVALAVQMILQVLKTSGSGEDCDPRISIAKLLFSNFRVNFHFAIFTKFIFSFSSKQLIPDLFL